MNPPRPRSWNILFQPHAALLLISGLLLLASPTAHAIIDVNNNSVSDLWEKHYNNGQRFTHFDPLADPDGDGWTNAQEAAAGTNPFDANPPNGHLQPEIIYYAASYYTDPVTNITETESPAIVTLYWPTLPGKQYTLLYSTDLAPGTWYPLGPPEIGTGEDMGNGITLTQQDGSMADRLFWRVAVTDPVPAIDTDGDSLIDYEEYLAGSDPVISDSDGDTLSDYAEIIAGTNPNHADEDGDGWTDPQEIAAGTASNNQDTDGDGIPDSLDSQPLVSIHIFADTDGDGIPDPNDPDPNNSRGLKPLIQSENAPGNPLCELEVDEISNFILTASNPSGPAPTSSDFQLYLNGTEETANITALATPPNATGTQRFLLSWTARVTTSYPEQTLQNLSLRFRDAQNATTWFNLARADVAEWEGMIAGIGANGSNLPNFPVVNVVSHYKGVKQKAEHLVRVSVGSVWYRGPKAVQLLDASGSNIGATAQISSERYPLFIISKSGSAYVVEHTLDIADPMVFTHDGKFYVNRWSTDITMSPSAVASIDVPAGGIRFQSFPPAPETGTPNFGVRGESYIDDEYKTIYSAVWSLKEANLPFRRFSGLIFHSWTDSEGEVRRGNDGIGGVLADIGATITPHSAGTLEYPGLPISSPGFPPAPFINWPGRIPLLPVQSGQWHKLVLKVGPDAGALSNDITLKLGMGQNGDGSPQSGFSLQVKNSNSFSPLALPGNGKIEMLPTSELYQKLTSLEGLTLFLKRDETVTESHRLGLDLIPKRSTYLIQRVAAVDLLPVELRDVKDSANTADDVTIIPWDTSAQTNPTDTNIAWIEPHKSGTDAAPRMPQLVLHIPDLPRNVTLDAKLLVTYQRPYAGKQADDTVKIPLDGSFQSVANGRWDIFGQYTNLPFFGGDATLTYKVNGGTEQTIKFAIGGRNPDDLRCKTYTQERPSSPWYSYAIEKHESEAYNPGYYNQFWERHGNSSPINNGVNYTFTRGDALIVRSPGETGVGGTGLSQVTGAEGNKTVSAPREIFWNWQKNVDAFLVIMAAKIQIAETFMNDPTLRNGPGSMPNGQRPQTTFHTGNNVAVPSRVQGLVTFGDALNDKRPEDAVAIKAYNGASSHWCSWRGPTVHEWQFNYGQNNYVQEVCNEIEETQP